MRFEQLKKFYRGKSVLVTGHTGFKGSWLARILLLAGAHVSGYALKPPTDPGHFSLIGLGGEMAGYTGDIRDLSGLNGVFEKEKPEIVFHLAAQPIVREGYEKPVLTYETNVMGTVNVLECCRMHECVKNIVNVTTDKVYENREWPWGYRESDRLDGYDPYSNSKSCSELVTHSFRQAYFADRGVPLSTVRAGNVIGGGDFAKDRIIPDCFRAALSGKPVCLRNPHSVRPYQYVLEALGAYLLVAMGQEENPVLAGAYNVGPPDTDCVTTGELADAFCEAWGGGLTWYSTNEEGPHEAGYLRLDCSKLKATFGWSPVYPLKKGVAETVAWYKAYLEGRPLQEETDRQIFDYFSE